MKDVQKIRRKLFLLVIISGISLSFLVGCSCKTEPFIADTVAYPLKTDQQEKSGEYPAENVLSYVNDADETVLRIYSAPIEYSENAITHNEDGSYSGGGRFVEKTLPECCSQDNPICVTNTWNFAEITPADSGDYTSTQENRINIFGQSRDTVVYKDALGKGMDLNCSLTSFGFNLELVFSKRPEQNTYRIRLKLPDLIPDTSSSDYILFKTALEDGSAGAILETPLAADKAGNWSYANSVRLVEKESETGIYTVEYTIDEAFLSDKSTKYPVRTNQSISLYEPKQPDTSAYENVGDDAGHYLSPYMLIGDSTIKGEGWTFIRYETLEMLDIPADKIISAKYVFRNLFDSDKEVNIDAYAVTTDWCSVNTRWFNRPSYDERSVSQVSVQKAGDYALDITPLFMEMIRNKENGNAAYSINNGFLIKSNTPNSSLILPSGDGGLFSPYLEVVLKNYSEST